MPYHGFWKWWFAGCCVFRLAMTVSCDSYDFLGCLSFQKGWLCEGFQYLMGWHWSIPMRDGWKFLLSPDSWRTKKGTMTLFHNSQKDVYQPSPGFHGGQKTRVDFSWGWSTVWSAMDWERLAFYVFSHRRWCGNMSNKCGGLNRAATLHGSWVFPVSTYFVGFHRFVGKMWLRSLHWQSFGPLGWNHQVRIGFMLGW